MEQILKVISYKHIRKVLFGDRHRFLNKFSRRTGGNSGTGESTDWNWSPLDGAYFLKNGTLVKHYRTGSAYR